MEKSETFVPSSTVDHTQEISGLTTGAKRIVVVANAPASFSFPAGSAYQHFASKMIDLSTQVTSNGLTMSGEAEQNLTTNSTNDTSIEVSRVVAKVELKSLTVTPAPGHDGEFILKNVHIMKARGESTLGVPEIITSNVFYGGLMSTVSTTAQSFLTESVEGVTVSATNPRYFYVFPNDNTGESATLMVIEGTYNGEIKYFPFRIRYQDSNNALQYIARNDYYSINVDIKRPADGTSSPEELVDPAVLNASITVKDWNEIPEQSVSW